MVFLEGDPAGLSTNLDSREVAIRLPRERIRPASTPDRPRCLLHLKPGSSSNPCGEQISPEAELERFTAREVQPETRYVFDSRAVGSSARRKDAPKRTWGHHYRGCPHLDRGDGIVYLPASFRASRIHRSHLCRGRCRPENYRTYLELIATAEALLVRLEAEGVAVRLNLSGQPGDQPDYVVAAWVLPYIYALRGDRDWRRSPQLTGSRQVSQLAVYTASISIRRTSTPPSFVMPWAAK